MKAIVITLAVLLVIGGGYYWYGAGQMPAATPVSNETTEEETPGSTSGKLNIDVVCEGALAYMSFPDGESAARFVAECKAGEHPEVIERYKAEMGLGDGATI